MSFYVSVKQFLTNQTPIKCGILPKDSSYINMGDYKRKILIRNAFNQTTSSSSYLKIHPREPTVGYARMELLWLNACQRRGILSNFNMKGKPSREQ